MNALVENSREMKLINFSLSWTENSVPLEATLTSLLAKLTF